MGKHGPQSRVQFFSTWRLEHKVIPVVLLETHDWRGRWSQNTYALMPSLIKPLSQSCRPLQSFVQLGATDEHIGDRAIRRIMHPAAEAEFFIVEASEIMLGGVLDSVVIWEIRLQ